MAQTFTALWDAVAPVVPAAADTVWMAAPDIVAFYVDDPSIVPGNYELGTFTGNAYGTWFQRNNPGNGGTLQYCVPVGINRDRVKYTDLPPVTPYLDKIKLHTLANYGITGGDGVGISALYYRDEAIEQGHRIVASNGSNQAMISQRHTVLLKLSGVPTQGSTITITNTTAGIDPVTFTVNDKVMRAGALQVNQLGYRPNDTLKYAYLAMRLPKGPNNGTIQFGAAPYNMTNFQILDSAKATVFTGEIVQRCNAAKVTGEGYDNGIDVADLSVGWVITAINKATSTLTVPGHGLAPTDKVRFFGVNGMLQLENPDYTNGANPVAVSVTAVSGDDVTISTNTSGFTDFNPAALNSEALGGTNNRIFKCFNTNRAGTYVYGLDFSSWTPTGPGTYYVYIPGYGISDPLIIASDVYAKATAKLHEGIFNLRLGIAVSSSSGYTRGVASKDGTNGCQMYQSTLVSLFCSEGGQLYGPVGAPQGAAGAYSASMGGRAGGDTTGTAVMTVTAVNSSGTTTATATTAAPHGVAIGNTFLFNTYNFVPAGYNVSSSAAPALATSTGTNTFTYAVAAGLAAGSTMGFIRTGCCTNVRVGGRAGHQDAGDNDDIIGDHIPKWKILAQVFRNIPKPSRFTPYTVPLSSAVLDPVLFPPGPNDPDGGTDDLPPLFHEMFWYAEAYRTTQEADGSVWGGFGLGAIGSVRAHPETIDLYHGVDAGGALTGQTVMGFAYARDHFSTFQYSCFAALLAQIAYDYGLTALGDDYKESAIAAYAWADAIITNPATCDAYYKGVLNLRDKQGWTEASYQNAMRTFNGYSGTVGRAVYAKFDAAGALYHLLGSTAGQAYGNFYEKNLMYVATVASGGSGYSVNDILTLTTGATVAGVFINPGRILVTAVDGGGAITGREIMNVGLYTTNPTGVVSATGGTGTGATFTCTFGGGYSLAGSSVGNTGNVEYCLTPGANTTAKNYMQGPTRLGNTAAHTLGLNPAIPYMGLYQGTAATTGGGTLHGDATMTTVQAHIQELNINNDAPTYSTSRASSFYKVMQAGAAFTQGCNLANKCYITGAGVRPYKLVLHEDSFFASKPAPYGLNAYGFATWANANMNSNFGGSVNGTGDSSGIYNADNTGGLNQALATPGASKVWNPWRGGSAYWEWSPENRAIITVAEFTLPNMLQLIAMELWLHGWDGNV
jgi:hypothetical protein